MLSRGVAVACSLAAVSVACSPIGGASPVDYNGPSSSQGGAAATGGQAGGAGGNASGSASTISIYVPDGGYPAGAIDSQQNVKCDDPIAVIRDFRGDGTNKHVDFEPTNKVADTGIVTDTLGSDQKPVYAHTGTSTARTVNSPTSFNQWYRDVSGINMRFAVSLPLVPDPDDPSLMVYDNQAFFPIDGKGFGNTPGQNHNFSFTTEIHTKFTYKGGEVFTFKGDDDVFAYVNNKLVIDLGGIHAVQQKTVNFDEQASKLGIVIGGTYPMDIFHAERHIVESHFRMEVRNTCLVAIILQ